MPNLSNYLVSNLLAHTVGKTGYPLPTVYIALYLTTPSATGTDGTEVAGGSYARIASSPSWWNSPTIGTTVTITNAVDITWPSATANWGTVNGAGLLDASSGGNLLWFGALTTPKIINSSDTFRLLAGSMTLSMQ